MLQTALLATLMFFIHLLTYLVKSQTPGWSTIAIVLLAIVTCGNILATIMPGLIAELWKLENSKVSAHSFGLWFCLAVGIAVGIGS